jgi:hypothetical protein
MTVARAPVPNRPRPERVAARDGVPVAVAGERVEAVVEDWLVEDRWWAERPIGRRYWEVVTVRGRNVVVFHDLLSGRWFRQAA